MKIILCNKNPKQPTPLNQTKKINKKQPFILTRSHNQDQTTINKSTKLFKNLNQARKTQIE